MVAALSLAQPAEKEEEEEEEEELAFMREGAPPDVVCPLSGRILVTATVAADGYTYEKEAIEAHRDRCKAEGKPFTSPLLGVESGPLTLVLVPNHLVRVRAREWAEKRGKEWAQAKPAAGGTKKMG